MGVTEMLRAATLILLLDTSTGYSFRVCGNYCGPGWCNAQWQKEEVCDDSAPTDGSCEDACCKTHDTCCGHKTPSTGKAECNTAIIACLHACRGENVSQWCRDGLGIPISNRVLADAMHLVEGWCCGGPCPKAGDDGAPLAASSAVYYPERSGSLLVEEPGQNASAEPRRNASAVREASAKPLATGHGEVEVEVEVGAETAAA